jgi:hypoxanthine phosphoribosyltransferase
MLEEIQQVTATAQLLYSSEAVEAALDKLAQAVTLVLQHRNPLVLCVMNGGIVMAGKLMPRLPFPLQLDSIYASRYHNQTSGSEIHWLYEPRTALRNRTVLLVDDVLDEGITLHALVDYCRQHGASSVYTAVLVDKQLPSPKPIKADFVGVETDNRYLFGYGMDYKGYCRNLPGIYALKEG